MSSNNHIIRIKKTDTPQQHNTIIRKSKTRVIGQKKEPTICSTDIISEYSIIMNTSSINADISKDEMIEKVECQRDILIQNANKYSAEDYTYKMKTIENLLSKLKVGRFDGDIAELCDNRSKIDKTTLSIKKLSDKQFKTKIDLTGDYNGQDPSIEILTGGRKFYENQKTYQLLPKELQRIAPKKGQGFGNQPLPVGLLPAF